MKDDKPKDLVELHRMKYPTAEMMTHPPIPVADFAHHVMSMKADDAEKIVQEFEVCMLCLVISELVVEFCGRLARMLACDHNRGPFIFKIFKKS